MFNRVGTKMLHQTHTHTHTVTDSCDNKEKNRRFVRMTKKNYFITFILYKFVLCVYRYFKHILKLREREGDKIIKSFTGAFCSAPHTCNFLNDKFSFARRV